jgi:deazaflavin-dependent oxidoreductase (nitroreductase family)
VVSTREERNRQIVAEFRANAGTVGGRFANMPLLLLHHRGARSGIERVNPLAYQRVGEAFAIFASQGGSSRNPAWYYNLVANPDAWIEAGGETHDVRARVATGGERERIWSAQKDAFPVFAEYERSVARQIPVVVLDRA